MPFEAQLDKPGIIGMTKWNLQHDIIWQFKDSRLLVGHLDHEREQIKRRPFSSFPTVAQDHFGKFHLQWVSDDRAIRTTVARITDKLRIPDTDARLPRFLWSEDGDRGANLSTIGCETNVLHERIEDLLRSREVAHIPHDE